MILTILTWILTGFVVVFIVIPMIIEWVIIPIISIGVMVDEAIKKRRKK